MNNIPGQREADLPKILLRQENQESLQELYTEKSTYILWIVSSWLIAFLNLIFVMLTIRDLWNNGYSAGTHGFSIAIVTATIFGLMLIHEKIIRK